MFQGSAVKHSCLLPVHRCSSSFQMLRALLPAAQPIHRQRRIVATSSLPSEGKLLAPPRHVSALYLLTNLFCTIF